MKYFGKTVVGLLVLIGCSIVGPDLSRCDDIYPVSLAQLIVSPTEWSGRTVAVFGYLEVGLEPVLYLTRNHGIGEDRSSAISVERPDSGVLFEGCGGRYVTVIARFLLPNELDSGLYDVVSMTYRSEETSASTKCFNR